MRVRHLAVVSLLALLAACASRGHQPSPFPEARGGPAAPAAPSPPGSAGTATTSALGLAVAEQARALLGTPYRRGGATPGGFDCSGLVHYVYGEAGVQVPRTVEDLYRDSVSVGRETVVPGDLLFFRTHGRRVSHVGIARDEHTFIHAPTSGGVVRVEQLSSGYWTRRFAGARRLPQAARVAASAGADNRRDPAIENDRSARSASEY